MDWTNIITAIIALLGAVVTGILIPYVKSKLNTAQLEKLDYFTRIFVAAAEVKYQGADMGELKKAWVFEQLKGAGVKFNEATVSAAIDAFVEMLTAEGIVNTGA